MGFQNLYEHKYKKILIIPIILLLLSVSFLLYKQSTTGYFIERDFSIKGGISATIETTDEINIQELESQLSEQFPDAEITIRKLSSVGTGSISGAIIEESGISKDDLSLFINEQFPNSEVSIQEVGARIGATFFKQMLTALLFAFVLMAIVVFITFRKFIPSMAIILSAFLDILIPLAIISFLGFKLSTASIAAFLLIIGYSIDTDILLTSRLLKRKDETLMVKLLQAFKTGITMTATTLAALIVALIFAWQIPILKQMFSILTIALIVDIVSTWLMNAPILIWWMKKNETN